MVFRRASCNGRCFPKKTKQAWLLAANATNAGPIPPSPHPKQGLAKDARCKKTESIGCCCFQKIDFWPEHHSTKHARMPQKCEAKVLVNKEKMLHKRHLPFEIHSQRSRLPGSIRVPLWRSEDGRPLRSFSFKQWNSSKDMAFPPSSTEWAPAKTIASCFRVIRARPRPPFLRGWRLRHRTRRQGTGRHNPGPPSRIPEGNGNQASQWVFRVKKAPGNLLFIFYNSSDTLQNPSKKKYERLFPEKKTNPLQTSQHGSLDHQKTQNPRSRKLPNSKSHPIFLRKKKSPHKVPLLQAPGQHSRVRNTPLGGLTTAWILGVKIYHN